MDKVQIIESQLRKALEQFNEFYSEEPTDIHKAGTIQAFEFTFELSWKYLRETLKQVDGESYDSPRAVFKLASKKNIYKTNVTKEWLEFTKYRNLTVHMYNQEIADKIYKHLETFGNAVATLMASTQNFIEEAGE